MDILGGGAVFLGCSEVSFRRFVVGLRSRSVLLGAGMLAEKVCILCRLLMSQRRAAVCGGSPYVRLGTVAQGRDDCLFTLPQVDSGGTLAALQPNKSGNEFVAALMERAPALARLFLAVSIHSSTLDPMCSNCPGANGPGAHCFVERCWPAGT